MNILYIHQFYAGPESPGPAQPRALTRCLAARGHQVEVLACDVNAYNEQTEPPESFQDPAGGSVRVRRLSVPRKLRASLRNRLATYLRFAWSAYREGRRMPAPDVVLVTIQPLFSGIAALRLARHWRKPMMLEVRDFWPDALVVKKAISKWQAIPLQALARSLYFGADRVVSLTPGIKIELLKKGVPANRLDVFPNGFEQQAFDLPAGTRPDIRREYGWDNRFVAIYTGSLTEVTAVETMVRAAAALKDRKDIRFDIFGFGQRKPVAMDLARELKLDNIHFHEPVPKSRIPALLAGADAAVMTLFRSPLIHIYFENKFIDYMGSRLPIMAALDGVQADLIRQAGAGQVVPTFDHQALAAAIADAADDPARYREMGEAGYRFISTRLDQRRILDRYALTLEALAQGEAGGLGVWNAFAGM